MSTGCSVAGWEQNLKATDLTKDHGPHLTLLSGFAISGFGHTKCHLSEKLALTLCPLKGNETRLLSSTGGCLSFPTVKLG
jgi:hypothetical protein